MEPRWAPHYPPGVPLTATYPDWPLWGALAEGAARHPDRLAIAADAVALSYAELWRAARETAGELAAAGVEPGDRVLAWLPNGLAFPAVHFGALVRGAIFTAASPAHSEAELAAQIADAHPRALATTPDRAEALRRAAARSGCDGVTLVRAVDQARPSAAARAGSPSPFACDAATTPAVLQYTSGTTGQSKGATISHRNLVANALQNARWFGWTADERQLLVLPMCHTWGLCCGLHSTLAVGGELHLADASGGFDADDLLARVARVRATVLYGSATMMHRVLACETRARHDTTSLAHVKAGAMLSQGDLKRRWDAAFPHAPLQQGYGLSEASPETHNNPPHAFAPGTVGVPIQDTHCRIADPERPDIVLGVDTPGEVQIRGPQVMLGYWRREEATRAAMVDGWLRTGDLGAMDARGYLAILDRLKDLIKFRGYSISPATIEECLLRHPAVRECIVVGRRCDVDGERPVAFVVGDGASAVEAELAALCRRELAPYEVPREWRFVTAIPKNHVGKPLRRVVRQSLDSGSG